MHGAPLCEIRIAAYVFFLVAQYVHSRFAFCMGLSRAGRYHGVVRRVWLEKG